MGEPGASASTERRDRLPARVFLIVAALTYLGFGAAFLLFPAWMSEGIDLALRSPVAVTDVRATYGGLELGLGVFLAICAAAPRLITAGLLATTLTVAGFGIGRMTGLLLDGPGGWLHPGFFALELTATAVGVVLLVRGRARVPA